MANENFSNLDRRHFEVPADYYDRGIKNNFWQRIWHKRRFAQVVKVLDGIAPEKILDIGCHEGTISEVLAQKFPQAQVFGIDISAGAIEYAKKARPQIQFQVAQAEELPFEDNSFGLVACFDLLEHLPNPQKALLETRRVLKNGGELVLTIPTEDLLFRLVWFFWSRFGPARVWQDTHVQNFNHHKLDKLLEKTGFTIKRRQTVNLLLLLIKAQKT